MKYIDTGEIDITNLYPSFPTGGIIINKNDIHNIYETGKGKVILRGKAEIKNNTIIITELPYQVYVQPYVETLTEMAIKDELTGIDAVYNKSGKNTLLIEIECSDNPANVLRQLYAKTDLQKNYNANQWALVGKTPKLLTLKDYCEIYLNHNISCVVKEWEYDLKKATDRLHIVNGLLIALEDIDNIIQLIKKSESSSVAKTALIKNYSLSEEQAKAILAMRLSSLAHIEKVELEKEKNELSNQIADLNYALSTPARQRGEIRVRLENLVNKFRDARKTELTNITIKPEEKEIEAVVPEDCVVVLTQTGDIKRVPTKNFRVQRKNGKGVKSDEAVLDMISTNTIDTLMFFTDKGKMYRTVVDNVPVGTNSGKGIRINTLINLEPNENVIAMTSLYRKTNAKFVVFFTKKGLIKKTYLEEYTKVKRNAGIQAIKLADDDSIANVTFLADEDVIVVTEQGMAIRFETKNIGAIGRVTAGVKSIKLADEDSVIIGLPIHKNTDTLAVFSNNGYGKKTSLVEFPMQGRAGKGVVCYKTNEMTGKLVGALMISDDDNIILTGKPNSICVSAKDVPLLSRNSSGNTMIKNSKINSTIKL